MPLRCAWAVHPSHCLCAGETLPMWKPTTGEPYAGEPHVRFGGRGGPKPFPTPIGGGGLSVGVSTLDWEARRRRRGCRSFTQEETNAGSRGPLTRF